MSEMLDAPHCGALKSMFWRSEILQVMYWLRGEGFGEEVDVPPTAPGAPRLEVRREYSLVIDARNGRRFAGRVFAQHSSSEICTLLDTGEPLEGLEPADYLG